MTDHASIPFSLHCTICYEAFDPVDRPPVILPCGHTYLCSCCAKRLKTCMECRTPLFTYPPRSPTSASPPSSAHSPGFRPSRRHSPRSRGSPVTTVAASEPVPLPTPRNLVLISLLESAKRTVGLPEEASEKGYESGDDDEQVLEGMRLIASDYGTYVVKETDGLVIYDEPPDLISSTADKENQDRDFISLTRSESRDEDDIEIQMLPTSETDNRSTSSPGNKRPPSIFCRPSIPIQHDTSQMRLCYGQTAQVVSFENGIAQLARGRGYLVAAENQLVKIGDSKDEACTYEGMLSHLTQQKQALLRKVAAIEQSELEMSHHLRQALELEEIEPFAMAPGVDYLVDEVPGTPPPQSALDFSDSSRDATPTRQNASPGHFPNEVMDIPSFPELGATEFDDFVLSVTTAAREREVHIQEAEPGMLTCTDILPAFLGDDELCGPHAFPNHTDHRRVTTAESVMNHAAPETNIDRIDFAHGVDFRTGRSGHMALTSASSHADRRVIQSYRPRLMSQTNGISRTRKIRSRNGNDSPHSLSNPTW